MQWINNHRRIWGVILLFLLIVSLLGTWGYDLIHVPAQYDCSLPNVRLEGDFCGSPVIGLWGINVIVMFFINAIGGKLSMADLGIYLTFLMIPLPLISASLWVVIKNRRRQWLFHLVAWGLAAVFIWFPYNVLVLTGGKMYHPARRWGLWLYTAVVTTVFFIEIVQSINRKGYNRVGLSSDIQTTVSAEKEASQP